MLIHAPLVKEHAILMEGLVTAMKDSRVLNARRNARIKKEPINARRTKRRENVARRRFGRSVC